MYFLKYGKHINGATRRQVNRVNRLFKLFKIENNILYYRKNTNTNKYLIFPKPSERKDIIISSHELGHFAANATYERVTEKYYWHKMKDDIIHTINNCKTCLRNNKSKVFNHQANAIPVNGLNECVQIDLHFGLEKTKDGYVRNFVWIEKLLGWPIIIPIKTKSMEEMVECCIKCIADHKPPKILISDQGKEWLNDLVANLLKKLNISHKITSAYNPRTNGKVERANRTIVEILRKYSENDPECWDDWIPFVLLAYRSKVNSTTGYTPYELMYGRKMNMFEDWINKPDSCELIALQERAKEIRKLLQVTEPTALIKTKESQETQKRGQDNRQNQIKEELEKGTIVYIKKEGILKKLEARFSGPYIVERKTSTGNYILKDSLGAELNQSVPRVG